MDGYLSDADIDLDKILPHAVKYSVDVGLEFKGADIKQSHDAARLAYTQFVDRGPGFFSMLAAAKAMLR